MGGLGAGRAGLEMCSRLEVDGKRQMKSQTVVRPTPAHSPTVNPLYTRCTPRSRPLLTSYIPKYVVPLPHTYPFACPRRCRQHQPGGEGEGPPGN